MIKVIGFYSTEFGEIWDKSLTALIADATLGALADAKIEKEKIDAVFFANMLSGVLENNLMLPARISEVLGTHKPVFRTEAACASGAIAFHLAKNWLMANPGKTALVVGAEKLTDYSPEEVTAGLAAAASGEEQAAGLTFPGLYAMMAQVYMQKYKYTEENLAYVSHKNHYHGTLNPKAHFRRPVTIDQVLKSAYVAYPLKVLDSSPISDGASAVIVTSDESLAKRSSHAVSVLASETATDSISLKGRTRLDGIEATQIAADLAFSAAKLGRGDIDVAEVHDSFSIAELFAMEDLGFWKKGSAGSQIRDLATMIGKGGKLTVNTSGGLKAGGHPVGATGVKQIGEIYLQLTNQADRRQLKKVKYGLTHNVGGSGGVAVVTILGT
ncbi:MAG TPA: thiolase domain-containing protein [Patescibacteria group bacterium]|nr:thiolase domain-containing protein [Patescibacteria group bacterium]